MQHTKLGRGTLKLCENCYVKGLEYTTNDRWHNIGGFIGTVRGTSTFTNCYVYNAKLKAGGGASVGGFASSLENANANYTFNNCYTANLTMENSSQGERAAFYPFVNNKRIYNYQIAQGDSATGTFGANWKNVIITANSCYAEQNGANGEMQGNYDTPTFTAAASYGTLNKSVSEINSALVSNAENCQFRTTASLNGGFPALKWEKEPEVNAYTVRTVAVDEDDKINVTLSENVKTDGAKVYVAAYTYDRRLENAYSANVTTDEVKTNVLTNKNATQVRVYVWDSNLNPIAETYTAKCRDGLLTEVVKTKTDVDTPEDEPTEEKISVFMVGDSIMDDVGRTGCSYATQGDEWCKRGWEGFIGNYLKSDKVSVIPHGHNGRTVEYLMKGINASDNCSWESIKRKLYPGDFIILGLGTNDNARLSPNGTIKNGVTEKYTQEQFVAWYKTIINDATAKGAKVILTKPLPTQNQIDNDGKFVTTSTQTYAVAAIDKVVEETGVACVDLSALCATAFNAYAVEKGLQPADLRVSYETANGVTTAKTPGKILVDYCHLTGEAADITAKTFATAIKGMNTGLEKYLNF